MFVNERPLLVRVALQTWRVRAGRQPCLFQLEAAVRIVAIRTFHSAFQNFMMERLIELVLRFAVATQAKLRLTHLQHLDG